MTGGMRLDTAIAKRCEGFPLHRQATDPDPLICAVLYWPIGTARWYITGYNPKTYVAYGFVRGMGADEWGHFSVQFLLMTRIAGVMPAKIDEAYKPVRASKLGIARPAGELHW